MGAETRAKKLAAKADDEATLADTTITRDDDVKYMAETTTLCEQKAAAFAERQKLRNEEIEAIQKAIEIISSESVAGAAGKHLPGLVQTGSTSLAQLRTINDDAGMSVAQHSVAEFLKIRAKRLNSRMLAFLAVQAQADPFKKVRKMIQEMIDKLLAQAAEEASHKEHCDTELATNEATRKEKTEAI